MKQTTLRSLISRREWRFGGIALVVLLLAWFGLTPSSAQLKNPKRVTSVRAADAPDGSRVTVVSDSALSDYEAYRRGDRFYVKVPDAGLSATQPKLRGNGFEDVEVQKSGDGIIFSFRLQPGTAARVNQRMNRLDVIFSTPARSQNAGASTARLPNTTGGQSRATDVAGPVPPGTTRSSRDPRNPSEVREGTSTAQTRAANSNSRSGLATEPSAPARNENAASASRDGSTPASSSGANTGNANSASSETQSHVAQSATVASTPASTATASQPAANSSGTSNRWSAPNWLLLLVGLLILAALALLFGKRKGYIVLGAVKRWQPKVPGVKAKIVTDSAISEPVLATAVSMADVTPGGEFAESWKPPIPSVPVFAEIERSIGPNTSSDFQRFAPNPLFAAAPLSMEKQSEPLTAAPAQSNSPSRETNPLFAAAPLSTPTLFERTDAEVKKLLAGSHYDTHLIDAADSATRQAIAAQLLAAIGGSGVEQHGPARQAFLNHGYFDDLTRSLRTADSPAERAAAAAKLGQVGNSQATAHLMAALHDSAPEVRRAAVESLRQMADPAAIPALNDLLSRETSRQLPISMIRQAINACAANEAGTQVIVNAAPLVTPVAPLVTPAATPANGPADKSDVHSGFQAFELEAFREFMDSRVSEQARAIDAAKRPSPALPAPAAISSPDGDDNFAVEETRLLLQEQALRRAAEALEGRRLVAESAKKTAEANAHLQAELETRAQADAEAARIRAVTEARQHAEVEARRRIEQEAAQRLTEEEARRTLEAALLINAQAEAAHRAEEENTFRLEAETLRRAAEELARKRLAAEAARKAAEEEVQLRAEAEARRQAEEMARLRIEEEARRQLEEAARRQLEEEMRRRVEEEANRLAAAEAGRRAEEELRQREAEVVRSAEEERLRLEREALLQAAAELTRRRAEVEQARIRATEEARLLLEAKERIRVEDEKRRLVEEERKRLEAEAQRRAVAESERIAEARQRGVAEQKRVEELARLAAEEEERRLSELENIRRQAEERARQRSEQEERIRAEIEVLRQAEEAQQQRIEAETRRRAEAQARLKEEGARLQAEEGARLMAEEEARLKAEQEAMRLAKETRLRAEEEARRRAEVEARLQEEKARLQTEVEARRKAEEEVSRLAAETRLRAEEEARRRAEVEAQLETEQVRLQAEAEARTNAEAEARRLAEEARLKVETEARLRAEQEVRSLVDEETEEGRPEEVVLRDAPASAAEGSTPWFDVEVDGNETTATAVATPARPTEAAKGLDVVSAERGLAHLSEDSSIPSDILKKFNSTEPFERSSALAELAQVGGDDAFRFINRAFDDQVADVRNAAAKALYDSQPDRAASFTRALRESSPERRRTIGEALATSGLASDAIGNLTGESREKTYDAFSLLFLMAKAGQVQPLMDAIEEHESIEVRLAVVKLLALSGQSEIVPAFRRLAVRGSLPSEVRSAVMEAIYQISTQSREGAPVA